MQQIYPDVNNELHRREARKKQIKKIVKYTLRFELLYFDYLSIYPSIKLLINFIINQYNYLFSKIKKIL